jgi:hypothetical protein
VAEAFPVEDERHARDEVRLADDELPAARDLDDDEVVRAPCGRRVTLTLRSRHRHARLSRIGS